MLVIHAGYKDGFFLWGECSDGEALISGTRRGRPADGGAGAYILDPGPSRLIEAAADIGIGFAGEPGKASLLLPTFREKYPIPSTPLLYEVPAMDGDGGVSARPWEVGLIRVSAWDLLAARNALTSRGGVSDGGRFVTNGLMVSWDFCYMMDCCDLAASIIGRGRFLPDIRVSPCGGKYIPAWRPLLIGDDALELSRLARRLPDVIRINAPETRGVSAPDVLAREILRAFTDGLVRYAWSGRRGEEDEAPSAHGIAKALVRKAAGAQANTRRRRGKIVNLSNPHALWARSLGWLGEIDSLSHSLESIYPYVEEWRRRYEWFENVSFKLRLTLSGGTAGGIWSFDYSLARIGTSETIPAEDVWSGRSDAGRAGGDYTRRFMLLMLGRVGEIFGPVKTSLESASPARCVMSAAEAASFLSRYAPEVEGMGVEVIYPEWRKINAADLLKIHCVKGENGLVRWKLAWDGELLEGGEARAFAAGASPLVWFRGDWLFVPPDYLEKILQRMEKLPAKISGVEAVRLAIRDPLIGGFTGLPVLEAEYAALKDGAPPELLGAPEGMTCSLRPYQERGYSWLAFLCGLGIGACLADDMGLGKTIQTLALVQSKRNAGDCRPVLIVCPTSVLENWRGEIERFFPRMSCYVHHGKDRLKGVDFARVAGGTAATLSSYALIHRDAELFRAIEWQGVVLDEAQNIKNPDTLQTKAVRALNSEWRVALTGTPIENHVGDVWSVMEFLMPGLLGSRRHFHNAYLKPLKEGYDANLAESLRRSIKPLILRRLKNDPEIAPDLPEKIITKVYCGLKREQSALYLSVTGDMNRRIRNAEGMKRRGLVLACLTRIKQICDHPSLATKDFDFSEERSSKLERLLQLAEEMFEEGDSALIFTQYTEMGNIMKYQLQEHFGREVLFLHGALPKNERDKMVRVFQNSSGPRFFVLSLRAGGVGLNLTRANHVVMFDRWWNPAVETQAIDRAYRIGQTRNVQVHIFCCQGTIEERIDEIISSKRGISDSIVMENDNWVTELSDGELRDLVALSPRASDS